MALQSSHYIRQVAAPCVGRGARFALDGQRVGHDEYIMTSQYSLQAGHNITKLEKLVDHNV